MAKIYKWDYKEKSGTVVANNMKSAKREVANQFGNAIKIPKGTKIKKVGLADSTSKTKSLKKEELTPEVIVKQIPKIAETGEELTILNKNTSYTNVSFLLDGNIISVGSDTIFIAHKGSRISHIKNL